ncbi:MAG: Rrf2 family transcriptional regulator [Deltaproteobacteria bacterium]|nr:Rrf2 family transcriptional regulator [Deltaproteobacteria bacterium]
MNLTAKSRYALKIMMDLALNDDLHQRQRQKIATRQGIPIDFMDHILARLRDHGLIRSTRGRSGGLSLKKQSGDISLWEIFSAVEENLYPVRCMDESGCAFEQNCITLDVWGDVYRDIRFVLSGRSLRQVCDKLNARNTATVLSALSDPTHSPECRRPVRHLTERA